ncbi:regulatory protein MarR [Paludibacter propionicigenes WB4]|uniref:Regulatory protein MarR n=1 Tax=Paludibacter propionicigenes (strain DSM 17365 / JCM 13257 / WB4) TaxID=694427 RepID=E4T381_PALPW|nr:MarR family transcriptional regulator [Paludibacter propionicigenes]ADQ79175.1 regulatory protein MarR [Paludibacter propionicigenes WB4]
MNTKELSTSLRTVISSLHKGLRKQLYSANAYSMTEIDTIRHLYHSTSLLPSELAALTRIKTQSMSQILNKIEKQGVILRTPSETDKRKVYISLSPFGQEMVKKIKYDKDEWLQTAIEKTLTAEEKELLEKALPVLHKLIENK